MNPNDLQAFVWFQVFLCNTNNYVFMKLFLFDNSHLFAQLYMVSSIPGIK